MTRFFHFIFFLVLSAYNACLYGQFSEQQANSSTDSVIHKSEIQTGLTVPVNGHHGLSSAKIVPADNSFTNQLSVFDLLQGKISGLDITGAPDRGRNPLAIFRGQQILGKRLPLIVIDGIPWKPADPLFNEYNEGQEEIQSVLPINIEDIASVEVLKDDATTILYGTEGVDGVILIETKKGIQQKLHLSYQFNRGILTKPEFLPMLNGDEYIMYQLEGYHNAGIPNFPPQIMYDRDYIDFYNYSANTDWLKAVTQQGYTSDHYLNLTGGNKKNKFFSSVNFLDQKGNLINTDYSRFLSRLTYEHEFTEKLMFRFLLNYNKDKYRDNVVVLNEDGAPRSILDMASILSPNMSIYNFDSFGNASDDYFIPYFPYQGDNLRYFNPVAVSNLGSSKHTLDELSSTALLQYDLTKWLTFREAFTFSQSSSSAEAFLPFYVVAVDWIESMDPVVALKNNLRFRQYRNELQAIVCIPLQNKQRNSVTGTITWDSQKEDFLYPAVIKTTDRKFNAIITSIQYELRRKYTLTANARFESAKQNSPENNWNKHVGLSTGWYFAKEPILNKLGIFEENSLLHAGWSFSSFHPALYVPLPHFPFDPEYQIRSYNTGVEFGLFNNRLHVTSDYYVKSIRMQVYYDYWMEPYIFKVRNKGVELAIDYSIVRKKNVDWNVTFNLAHNKRKLVETPENINNRESAHIQSGQYVYYLYEGKSPDAIYGLDYEGVYSTDEDAISPNPVTYGSYTFKGGDAKYRDVNHDGVIDDNDLVNLGNTFPKFTGGLGTTARFRNLSLTCNFYYRTGYKIIDQAERESEGLYPKHNQNRNVLNRWRVQGQKGNELVPRAIMGPSANTLPSDRWVKDGRFIRMNYINLTYQLGQEACHKIHVHDFRISLSGQRLFTLTPYNGLDPETELDYTGIFGLNKDEIRLYPPRIYSLSFQITI